MYIRKKRNPRNDKWRVQIVEGRRDGAKVRQRVLRHVGTADEDGLPALRRYAEEVLLEMRLAAEAASRPLVNAGLDLTRTVLAARKTALDGAEPSPTLNVRLGDWRELKRLVIGPREAFGQVYDAVLNWREALGGRRQSANRILRELVLARLWSPASKRSTVKDLAAETGIEIDLNRVYQTMDFLDEARIARIQRDAAVRAERLLGEIEVVLFDTTTLHFESAAETLQEDADGTVRSVGLRAKGYSKDGKPQHTQVLFALLITPEGLPLGYRVYRGNQYEGDTLMDAVTDVQRACPHAAVTVIADAGLLNRRNCQTLRAAGVPYVLGYSVRKAPAAIRRRLETPRDDPAWELGADGVRRMELEHDGARLIVAHSAKRERKEANDRELQLDRLKERLERTHTAKSLMRSRDARFLTVHGDGEAVIDDAKVDQMARLDGLYAVLADGDQQASAVTLTNRYRQLWRIERAFRVNKTDLRIRPIYHWKPERIHAHLAICFMAYCCLQHLSHRLTVLGHPMSPARIRTALKRLQVTILGENGGRRRAGLPSPIDADGRRIYQAVQLEWLETPFPLPDSRSLHRLIETPRVNRTNLDAMT